MITVNGQEIEDVPQGSSGTVGYRWIVSTAGMNQHEQPRPTVTFKTPDGSTGTVEYTGRGPTEEGTQYVVTRNAEA